MRLEILRGELREPLIILDVEDEDAGVRDGHGAIISGGTSGSDAFIKRNKIVTRPQTSPGSLRHARAPDSEQVQGRRPPTSPRGAAPRPRLSRRLPGAECAVDRRPRSAPR